MFVSTVMQQWYQTNSCLLMERDNLPVFDDVSHMERAWIHGPTPDWVILFLLKTGVIQEGRIRWRGDFHYCYYHCCCYWVFYFIQTLNINILYTWIYLVSTNVGWLDFSLQAESAGSLEKEVYHLQRELLQERTKVQGQGHRWAAGSPLGSQLEFQGNNTRWGTSEL